MSENLRLEALRLAVSVFDATGSNHAAIVPMARTMLEFLEGGLPAEAAVPPTSAPRARKAKSSSSASPATESPTAPGPAASAPPASPPASPSSEPPTTGQLNTPPSTDAVRAALVALQNKTGSPDKSKEILGKYSKTGTLGGLAEADRSKVINECLSVL